MTQIISEDRGAQASSRTRIAIS